jgi:tetratricopeptide (TPR) repeat protein
MGKENIHCAAFSPDGRTLATGNQFGGVMLWDATTGQQSTTLQYYESPNRGAKAVAFSNDGKLLAAGNNEGMLRLWDAETGQLMMSFKGHTDTINSLAFSPDDKTLLSGSHDRTARLWDVVTGQELLTLKQHKSSVTLVSFAPDGKRLATSSGAEMKLWLAATDPEATAIRVELDPDDPDSPRAANNWGDRLQGVHRPGEAEIAYRKALGRLETLDATLPGTTEYRHELAYCLLGLSLVADLQPAAAQSERRFVEIWQIFSADHRLRFSERLLDCGEKRRGAGHFQEAVNVISKAIELTPDFDYAYHHRAHVYEDLKEWDRAWADFSEAIRISPMQSAHYACRARSFELRLPEAGARDHTGLVERTNFTLAWYNLALFKLQRGDHAGYRAVCSGMLEHLDQSVSVDDLFWIIWTCVLAPDGVADWTIPLKLAEKAHTDDRTSYDKLNHLGAMLYRAGRFQEATQRLTEAKAAFQHTSGTRSTIVYNWFFQAMAQHRLGHTTEAASWLKKAVEKIDMPSPKADHDPLEMTWNGHLTLQLLRREVEELLKEAPNDVEEKPSDDPDA